MSVSFSTIVQRGRPAAVHATNSAFREALSKLPPTMVGTLGNGVRVATEENPFAKVATVGLWLDVGIKHEKGETVGTMKVLEKAGFLGTTNQDRSKISKALEEIGGQLEVDFGREHSYLMVKCQKEHTARAVSVLADVVRNARLTDADVEAAKAAVNAARHEFEERVDDVVFDNIFRAAYDSTPQSIGHPYFGYEKTIRAISKTTLEDFRKENFVGKRMLLVGSGAVSQSELEKAAAQYLGDVPAGHSAPKIEQRFVGGDFKLWNLRMKTTHVLWGFETCGAACEDSVPLSLVPQITGNFHRNQHELGQHAVSRILKVYSSMDHGTPTNTPLPHQGIETMTGYLHQFQDTGLCGQYIVGRCTPTGPGAADNMMQLQQVAMAEWCRFAQKLVHPLELDQAKVNIKSQLLYNMDGSANSAKDIARQVLYFNRRVPLPEMYDRIDDVTPVNVQETLHHYFYGRKPVFSYMGYLNYLAGYDYAEKWTWRMWN